MVVYECTVIDKSSGAGGLRSQMRQLSIQKFAEHVVTLLWRLQISYQMGLVRFCVRFCARTHCPVGAPEVYWCYGDMLLLDLSSSHMTVAI